MKLSDTDLKQLDTAWALGLPPLRKDKLLVTLIEDLKEAREGVVQKPLFLGNTDVPLPP